MKKTIDKFLKSRKIAIAGVSEKKDNWGKELYKSLKENKYEVFPVNPNLQDFNGTKSYKNFSELPEDVDCLVFAVGENTAYEILRDSDFQHINSIWLIKGATSDRNIQTARDKNLQVVHSLCPLMFFYEKGFHRFHYKILKFFHSFPKEYYN